MPRCRADSLASDDLTSDDRMRAIDHVSTLLYFWRIVLRTTKADWSVESGLGSSRVGAVTFDTTPVQGRNPRLRSQFPTSELHGSTQSGATHVVRALTGHSVSANRRSPDPCPPRKRSCGSRHVRRVCKVGGDFPANNILRADLVCNNERTWHINLVGYWLLLTTGAG